MSNYAFSDSDSLMLGAGELYFFKEGDENGYHHLGNVDEFTISTEVETIDKYGSFSKRRELARQVESQITVSASMTFTEYDQYNLMLGTLGGIGEEYQSETMIVNKSYDVVNVPGIIKLGKQRNLYKVEIVPVNQTPMQYRWFDANNWGEIKTASSYRDLVTMYNLGGQITISLYPPQSSRYRYPDVEVPVYVNILEPANNIGSLKGLKVGIKFIRGGSQIVIKTFDDLVSDYIDVPEAGVRITFRTTPNRTFGGVTGSYEKSIYGAFIPPLTEYKGTRDFSNTDADNRLGIIRLTPHSRIKEGETVLISYIAPERTFKQVYGGLIKEINGTLIFVSDPRVGNQITVECHNVRLLPNGNIDGLIGEDFGSYKVDVVMFADYNNHPESPYYTITYNGHANESQLSNTFKPRY